MNARVTCFSGHVLLAAGAMMAVAAPGAAAAQANSLSLPAGALSDVLHRIATWSGTPVTIDGQVASSLRTRPVVAATDADEAIRQATRDLPVTFQHEADGHILVLPAVVVIAQRDEAETHVLVRQASTSSRTGLSLRDQPRNAQVISAKLLADQQAQTLSEALRNAGGVEVNEATIQGGVSYSVRGFSSNGSVNGMPTPSSSSFAAGTSQPVANIERLEVLKGPDAILLGGDNLGGTVNIVTKKPDAIERLSVSAQTGSYGELRGTLDANRPLTEDRRWSARVVATAATTERNFGGYRGNEDYLFAPSLRFKNGTTDVVLSGEVTNQIFGAVPFTILNPVTKRPYDYPFNAPLLRRGEQYYQLQSARLGVAVTQKLTDWVTLVVRGQHQQANVHLAQYAPFRLLAKDGTVLISASGVNQHADTDAADAYARFAFKTGVFGHTIITGGMIQDNRITADGALNGGMFPYNFLTARAAPKALATVYAPAYDSVGLSHGYYGQYLLSFWKVSLLAAIRRNDSESRTTIVKQPTDIKIGHATVPNFGAVVKLTDNVSVFGTLAYGFQPTFALDRNQNRLPDVRSRNAETGVKIDLFDKKLLLNASWFRIRQSNLLIPDPAAPAFQVAAPGLLGTGIDLNLAGEPVAGLSLSGSFTRTEYRNLTLTSLGNYVVAQPRDRYGVYTSYRRKVDELLTVGLGSGVFGRSSAWVDRMGVYNLPSSIDVDVNAFLDIGRLSLNVGVRNLLDRQNYGTTPTPVFLPLGAPQSWRLTVGYRFR